MEKMNIVCVLALGFLFVGIFETAGATARTANATSTFAATTNATTRTTNSKTGTSTTTTSALPTTSPLTPEQECAQHNKSCDDCLGAAVECLYCKSDESCKPYHGSTDCALDEARWLVCWLNFEALIISVSVIGGVIVLAITVCCVYCCCCRGKNQRKYDRDDSRFEQQKMERKMKQDERRTERKGKLDEIRRKYGLVKEDAPYQRFDA